MNKPLVIVTGSSYGLGFAVVQMLLINHFSVIGISRTIPTIDDKEFQWIKTDVTDEDEVKNLKTVIKAKHIDILINNAGTAIEQKSLEFTDDEFNKTFDLNFKAPINVTAALYSKLDNSLVMNISSLSDRFAGDLFGLYCASKAALNIYFDTVALEYKNIKVINILPDYIDTPLQHKTNDNKTFDWKLTMKPQQVADAVRYIIQNQQTLESGTRVIIIPEILKSDASDPEKLWVYNVDTKEMHKLK